MGIILWVILGGVAGWIASMVMKTDAQQGMLGNIVIGVIGALVGGALAQFLGGTGITGFNLYSLVVAIAGAVILLWARRAIA